MKAEELRIGNWVKHAYNSIWIEEVCGKPTQVDIDVFKDILFATHPLFEPIPLNPEILEKAGFVKNESGRLSLRISHALSLGESFENFDSIILYAKGSIGIPIHFRYLHQLQNLYFALTSSELPINL